MSHTVSRWWPRALGTPGSIFQERTQTQDGKWLVQGYRARKWQDSNPGLSGSRAVLSLPSMLPSMAMSHDHL